MKNKQSIERPYKDHIIHFIGAGCEYLGILQIQGRTRMGAHFRIKNPCFIGQIQAGTNSDGQPIIERRVAKYGMPTGDYEEYVDIYVPDDAPIEIRVLREKGALYDQYRKQRKREYVTNILLPGERDIEAVNRQRLQ